MENIDAISVLSALAQESRLDIFRYLIQLGTEGAAAGQIGKHFSLPPATLSFHLKTLQNAGIIHSKRQSRYLIYTANFAKMNKLLAYLTENCCKSDPNHCVNSCEHAKLHTHPDNIETKA